MRVGEFRVDGHGSIETRDRFVEAVQFLQRCSAHAERQQESRVERQRPVEIGDRLLVPPELVQSQPDIVGGLGVLRRQRERRAAFREGFLVALEAQQADAFELKRADLARLDLQ